MMSLYFLIVLLISVALPILLHSRLKRKIKRLKILLTVNILIGLALLITGLSLPFSLMLPSYPKITKEINKDFYFTQEEYGWAGSMPGKHLNFYKKKDFTFDKKIGHIKWQIGTGDFNAEIQEQKQPDIKRIKLTENNKLVLDTVLSIENGFDFSYLTWRN